MSLRVRYIMDTKISEIIKDITIKDISYVLYYKGHMNQDTQHKEVGEQEGNILTINRYSGVFGGSPFLIFLYKKTEKITSALYMVSNLFSLNEPMRSQMRGTSFSLLSAVVSYITTPGTRRVHGGEVSKALLELTSLCEISLRSGLLSPMNGEILKRECEYLLDLIDKQELPHNKDNFTVREDLFAIPEDATRLERGTKKIPTDSDTGPVSTEEFGKAFSSRTSHKGHSKKDSRHVVVEKGHSRKNNRRNAIISLLGQQEYGAVKDFMSFIKGCSEKTIQRELISLVASGVLKKEGERRWSRYSLVGRVSA